MSKVSDRNITQAGAVLSALLLEAKAANPTVNRLMICYDAPVEGSAPHWQVDIVSGLPGWGYAESAGEGATLLEAVADAREDVTSAADTQNEARMRELIASIDEGWARLQKSWETTRPATLYDWSNAPDWATHAAIDGDGDVYWYKGKPKISWPGQLWVLCWPTRSGRTECANANDILRRVDWRDSLEARP